MKIDENPLERWDLNPGDNLQQLTRALKKKSRKLSPGERQRLQEDWRALTSDSLYRAQAILLTPPPISDQSSDPFALAEKLLSNQPIPELPPLQPNLEDALILPLLIDEEIFANPPFLPRQALAGAELPPAPGHRR